MGKYKFYIATVLLLITAGFVHFVPAAKYVSKTTMSSLFQIPDEIQGWQGQDISNTLDINLEEARFGFISDALAYNYVNNDGDNLIFIVLDAGNFHHPKNCFISSGYTIKDLPDTEFLLSDRTVKAHTLFIQKSGNSFLSSYWIVINKNIAHEWVEQKFKQLYFTMFGKQRIGLMVRIDVPVNEDNIEDAMVLARHFVTELSKSLQPEHAGYLLGEK